jgi:membrane-associated phospholipid phosphatase
MLSTLMRDRLLRILLSCTLLAGMPAAGQRLAAGTTHADLQNQSAALPDAPVPQPERKEIVTLRDTPANILHDQAHIWTSPLHVHKHDLVWLAPLAVATGAAIATDHHTMASVVSHDPDFNQANVDASNVLIGGFIAAPVALYGFGHFKENAHAREAGILGGEALVDGLIVEQGMKLIFWRERPAMDNAHGLFFQGSAGANSSFPSSHTVLAWSTAALIADEYPSRWTQLGVYSLATGVSVTRVLGQQHFPTDVLVGSAFGWLVGHYVYRAHHVHGTWSRK